MESKHPRAAAFKIAMDVKPSFLSRALGAAKTVATSPMFWGPMAAAAVPMAAGELGGAIQRRNDARAKDRAYRDMLGMHAGLRKHDPVHVSRIYNSIHNANPMLARDPVVAGSIVENVINSNDIYQGDSTTGLLAVVKDLAGIRNHMSGAIRNEGGLGSRLEAASGKLVGGFVQNYADIEKQHGEVAHLRKTIEDVKARSAAEANENRAKAVMAKMQTTARQYKEESDRHEAIFGRSKESAKLLEAIRG